MVNMKDEMKRQVEDMLQMKIEKIEKLIQFQKDNQKGITRSADNARSVIEAKFCHMMLVVRNRRREFLDLVDEIKQVQNSATQERVESSYLQLGSLKEMLLNLDSYTTQQLSSKLNHLSADDDESGLIPVPNTNVFKSEILFNFKEKDFDELLDEIDHFGRVDLKCGDIDSQKISCVKRLAAKEEDEDEEYEKFKWPLYYQLKSEIEKENEKIENEEEEEEDDFVMFFNQEKPNDPVVPNLESENLSKSDEKNPKIDFSLWLKPKKINSSPHPPPPLVPLDIIYETQSDKNSKILDFPCLNFDPSCWLQPKKSKVEKIGEKSEKNCDKNESFWKFSPTKDSCNFNGLLGQKEIIPPSFAAMPYFFWLKK